ncbi:GrpB-like predicted nucleotidyltransferase (UPF0157 family) [Motilibacter peucedani]|uniref:GrpB-like predicted nucleotidyltransferase (UPF0157 family) n=1 Tax=Motilibacter peucedani TaxID=598650 RepID=A0A420XRL9_9ACTN|nr:GrpB family protein [Motilibacter peucedani]RKS77459.1 GrpB-like predicted nucleotidyltransferase (UPF0157 family) [Motilibacter peucedani]
MSDWPVWATEDVHVVPADPAWAQLGEALRTRLDVLLAPWLTAPVEHVGSTSVPGLDAKPVLDVQAQVRDLACAEELADVLAPEGWNYVPPELDERAWRRFYVLVRDDRRAAHLHVMTAGTPRWHEQVEFRDRLRADPDLRDAYATLKRHLAARHASDREAYTEGKAGFVRAVLDGSA